MSAAEESNGRISVSRADLRAELGALELRIVDRLSTAMSLKAEAIVVDGLIRTMNEFSRRTDAVENRVGTIEAVRKEWRFFSERTLAVISLLVAIAAVYLTHV